MSEQANEWTGAVVVGLVPGLPARVLAEAAQNARLRGVGLVAGYVDVTRFVTYEDPDGTPHSAPIDMDVTGSPGDIERARETAEETLAGTGVRWTLRTLVGDPAMALKGLADDVDAPMIVVGTRRRGVGETIREFFTGSVAARLAHRQHRPVLVVPLDEPLTGGEDPWVE